MAPASRARRWRTVKSPPKYPASLVKKYFLRSAPILEGSRNMYLGSMYTFRSASDLLELCLCRKIPPLSNVSSVIMYMDGIMNLIREPTAF